jgi:23S rRNA pseudouridine2605 synthase
MKNESVRLHKYMAECGVASRRKSEELISAGRVRVNGRVAQIGDSVDPSKDRVRLDGRPLRKKEEKVYIMLHKPRGVVTTMKDEMQRACVAELLKGVSERVFPVGRLDRDSEGLLLLTNDGAFANRLTHPSHGVSKKYRVTIRPDITQEQVEQFETGMELDGRMTAPVGVRVLVREENRVVLEMELGEGRNRQIRRMCEILGLEVARLRRISIGDVKLGMLPPGKWRFLTSEEVSALKSPK